MEDYKLVEKLKNEANISYEEAKIALEQSSWNILDAFVYLEEKGKVQKPSVSIFYTNEYKENHKNSLLTNNKDQGNNYSNTKEDNTFEGIFVKVCKIIDICNNIFFEIKKGNKVFLRIPVTVIILLLIFSFGTVIPLYIVGLFFDLEFSLSGKWKEVNKINHVFKLISENVKKVKGKLKRGFKNG
ncbi:ubiquitin [Clostridium diolis]|uniref:ubiquitin n=1 Tax=Clostridium diolis TaxID=223919 RepID=UPI000B406BD8|nr:ubiquitin [Clostridium diolis]OVE70195.1 ubiquitin [Clostridium diolis]